MRILILGASGLIGHTLLRDLSAKCEVYGTLHKGKKEYGDALLFSGKNIIPDVDVANHKMFKGILKAVDPDVILNCVGITKRKIEITNNMDVLKINSLFPHQLATWARETDARVIHFSTDCVFDGEFGNYSESSPTNAKDMYGRTKALGEINYNHTLTIRSSFIGQELFDKTELLEWFIAQEGKQIMGYNRTYYSGVSTLFMARVVEKIITNHSDLSGIYQLATNSPISKYDLLQIAKKAFNVKVDIMIDETHTHRPTLNGSKLQKEMDLEIPSWQSMMDELALNRKYYKS